LSLYSIVQAADVAPTPQALAALSTLERQLASLLARWNDLRSKEAAGVQSRLRGTE
jgi:hypothetical protein